MLLGGGSVRTQLEKVRCRRCSRLLGRADFVGVLEIICHRCGCKQLTFLLSNNELKSEIVLDNAEAPDIF